MKSFKANTFITIIMVASIITILTSGFYTIVSNNINITYDNIERSRLFFAAEGGLNYGLKWLKKLPASAINDPKADILNKNNLSFYRVNEVLLKVTYNHDSGTNYWQIESTAKSDDNKSCNLTLKQIEITPGSSVGEFKQALEFNGSTSYGTLKNKNLKIARNNSFTVMSWVKWSIDPQTGNSWANIITNNSSKYRDVGQFWLQHSNNNQNFEFALSTERSRRFVQSTTKPEKDVWYHLAGVYDGSSLKIYVNGIKENEVSHSGNIINHNGLFIPTIGGWAYDSDGYRRFKGAIDEVSLWEKALSEDEVKNNLTNPLTGKEDKLIAYWNFDENTGSELTDNSANKYDVRLNDVSQGDWTSSGAGTTEGQNSGNSENVISGNRVWDISWN